MVALLLVVFSVSIYFFSSNYREQEFYQRINDRALTTAKLLIEVNEVDSILIKIINNHTQNRLDSEVIVIYDDLNQLVYKSSNDSLMKITALMFYEVRINGAKNFTEKETQYSGIMLAFRNNNYVVFASAIDKTGLDKLKNLKGILIITVFISVIFSLLLGWIFSGKLLKPISNVISQVDKITYSNIDLRVDEGNKKDEIALLAVKFNKMLDRLEKSISVQKKFVSNASHELRNPLTSISGQIEVALLKDREIPHYKTTLISILEDIKNLRLLTNNLLELAQADIDTLFQKFEIIRIDEILWNTRTELIKRKPEYNVAIEFENQPKDENSFLIKGNERLLKTALINIMENACKYSEDKSVILSVTFSEKNIFLHFIDHGMGMTQEEMDHIFEPFYRADRALGISGYGIGISLSQKIVQLHKGEISLSSVLKKGTVVTIKLPVDKNFDAA